MTLWNITLNTPWFEFVKNSKKCYEGRCNWKQAAQYKIDDILVIKHHTDPHEKEFSVKIINIHKFDTFETALKIIGLSKILPNILTIEKGVSVYLKYYKLGRPYLPIGSAIKISVEDSDYLISAPTMLLPQDVRKTQNAYWATKAVMKVWPRDGTLFLPPMCCGYGRMDPQEAARQMKKAVDEESDQNSIESVISTVFKKSDDYYLYQPNLDEQPNYYENTEWKDIPLGSIVQKGRGEFEYNL